MNTKFKLGDTVRVIANTNASVNKIGDVGTITKVNLDTYEQIAKYKVTVSGRRDHCNITRENEIELVTKENTMEMNRWTLLGNFIASQDVFDIMDSDCCMDGHARKLFNDNWVQKEFRKTVFAPWDEFGYEANDNSWRKSVTKGKAVEFCHEMAQNGENPREAWTTIGILKTETKPVDVKTVDKHDLKVGTIFKVKEDFGISGVQFKKGAMCKITALRETTFFIVSDSDKVSNGSRNTKDHGMAWRICKNVLATKRIKVFNFPNFT